MMTSKNLLLLAGIVVVVLIISTLMGKCSRSRPVTKHQENREEIMKEDSYQSNIDSLYRAELDKVKQAYQDTIKEAKANYKLIVQKDVRIEYRYRDAPSLTRCDSVITSKNMRIGTLETMVSHQDYVNRTNDSLIISYAGSIRAKDQTIHQLNKGYEQATIDLAKAKKPRRWGIGAGLGYGVGPDLQPRPVVSVGLSYNFIRF